MYTLQGTEETAAELAQAEGETLHFGIDRVTCSFGIRKNCLSGRSLLLDQFLQQTSHCMYDTTIQYTLTSG
jgi:hypothetical protein